MEKQTIALSQMERGKTYKIIGTTGNNRIYSTYLESLGFTRGTLVERGPSSIADPFSVIIRGSRLALRKREAKELLIEEVETSREVADV